MNTHALSNTQNNDRGKTDSIKHREPYPFENSVWFGAVRKFMGHLTFWCDFASREHLSNRDVGGGGGGLFVLQSSNLYQMKALDE